ncbi:signal recognition particle 14 kDa protein-like [Arachis ipaensis]|uniref:signal recognition particle 14 kDa protein-like n=1 Tax=Arachis ipaensis TaxID=130454 RepID=UPI0007AF4867|nr:signal recognition particle 14 kDa protein-like [Arachis ipaensis]
MATAGEAIEYRCLIHATNGKKTISTSGVQKQLPVGASRVTLLVRNLKKKSLWSRILEEVMEKLVDIVYFLHLEIHEAFGSAGAFKNYK